MKFWIEVELADEVTDDYDIEDIQWTCLDAVYHTPDVKSVVLCSHLIVRDETTRRPAEWEQS